MAGGQATIESEPTRSVAAVPALEEEEEALGRMVAAALDFMVEAAAPVMFMVGRVVAPVVASLVVAPAVRMQSVMGRAVPAISALAVFPIAATRAGCLESVPTAAVA